MNYDKKDSKSLLSKDITCIFLGSNSYFKETIEPIDKNMYKHLIVPNWLLCSVKSKDVNCCNRYCISNKSLNDFTNNDHSVWTNLISLIKTEEKNIQADNYSEVVKNKILASLALTSNYKTINF
jgi:hypothetical protein